MKCFCPVCRIGWSDELEKCYECGGPLVEPFIPPEAPAGKEAPQPQPRRPQVVIPPEAKKIRGPEPTLSMERALEIKRANPQEVTLIIGDPTNPEDEREVIIEPPPKPKKSHKKKVVKIPEAPPVEE